MSILTAVWTKSRHLPSIPTRLWAQLKLGRSISDAAQGYADAVAIPHLITVGLEPQISAARERMRRSFDD
jgi:hypothetical protein